MSFSNKGELNLRERLYKSVKDLGSSVTKSCANKDVHTENRDTMILGSFTVAYLEPGHPLRPGRLSICAKFTEDPLAIFLLQPSNATDYLDKEKKIHSLGALPAPLQAHLLATTDHILSLITNVNRV